MNNKDGRVPDGTGLSQAEPEAGLGPSGFDPSRMRVRVILDCEWDDLGHALDMVIDAKPAFDSVRDRPGWGWHWSRPGKPAMFVRRTKHGYSATADRRRDSDGSPEGRDAKRLDGEAATARAEGIAHPTPPKDSPHDQL